MQFDNSFSIVSSSAPWFTVLIFLLLAITIIVNIVKSVRQWNYNKAQPVLSLPAKVHSKRADVTGGIGKISEEKKKDNPMYRYIQTVKYYVTFEVDNGKCIEFRVKSKVFDEIQKKEQGKLTYQGTRLGGFERKKPKYT